MGTPQGINAFLYTHLIDHTSGITTHIVTTCDLITSVIQQDGLLSPPAIQYHRAVSGLRGGRGTYSSDGSSELADNCVHHFFTIAWSQLRPTITYLQIEGAKSRNFNTSRRNLYDNGYFLS